MSVTVRFVGSGDSFGSGGRFQTCILVDGPASRIAIDFGTSSLIALAQQGIDPNSIDAIVLTHLHGDHCGGVPFLLVDAMLAAKRDRPLTIAGPRDPNSAIARGLRGVILTRKGEYVAADSTLRDAIRILERTTTREYPELRELYGWLADLSEARARPTEAGRYRAIATGRGSTK